MSLVEKVNTICRERMEEIANEICQDYKSMVTSNLKHPENSSGQAAGSIQVHKMSDTSYRIGSDDLHLYFFEMGNGSGGIPKNGRRPIRPMPMTYGTLGSPKGYAMRVSNYKGQNIKEKVAKKYNG